MRIPSFSVILIFVVLSVVGAGVIPLLNVQYTPSEKQKSLDIKFSWTGASARVVEAEVTSRLEGVAATVSGVQSINSVSYKERGIITITLKPKSNPEAVRYEIASLIRRIYSKLPPAVSYPELSASTTGENISPVLIYTVNAGMPSNKISEYLKEKVLKDITLIAGVDRYEISGVPQEIMEVAYSAEKLRIYNISPEEISSALANFTGRREIVGIKEGLTILLSSDSGEDEINSVPVKNSGGRIIRLKDLAQVEVKQNDPTFYYRINGLNTVNVAIYPEKGVNTVVVCNKVKDKIKELSKNFPDKFSAVTSYDASVYLEKELSKIMRRTILSILILLIFILITSRSLRYLAVIFVTLAANILIAFIFYYIFKLEIHLYSLAGITVSLGMVIDSSIIMISHYGYFRDRKAFISILAALLTTVGALSVIFFLPDAVRENLMDFAAVIIVNLFVSLAISLLLIPALIDKYPVGGLTGKRRVKALKRLIKADHYYNLFIKFGRRHRLAFLVLLLLSFGIPLFLLPDKIENNDSFGAKLYNKTLGSNFYQSTLKKPAEKFLGGTLRLFAENMKEYNIYREPQRTTLYINASMPEGCTIEQLNDIVIYMENYLSGFPEIDMFQTRISSNSSGTITVTFKKDYENSGFPLFLKQNVISRVIDFGGANWAVYGIDENSFNNNVNMSGFKSNRIVLTGYNYDQLYQYCLESVKKLSENIRVSDPGIYGNVGWNATLSRNEYFIDYDFDRMAAIGVTPEEAFSTLNRECGVYTGGNYFDGDVNRSVRIISDNKMSFDVWNLKNEYLNIGEKEIKFSDIGKIDKRRTGNDIYKTDQQYRLVVAFDFIGPNELAKRVLEREKERLNSTLPVGFKAELSDDFYYFPKEKYFWILFIIIAIIFIISSILFESLYQPLIILSLIPLSFIGLFLTFYFTGFTFDQGGLAALIMLSGVSVNAGIYIINQYNLLKNKGKQKNAIQLYIKAFNLKIIPILLTILSTVLGLLPFLFDGKGEVFWFAFAVGTMGGLVFSVIGILIFLPVWIKN
jgi:multidrug efflux pump subunit AcrB